MAGCNTSVQDQSNQSTKVELSFSCTHLVDVNVFSKSDPFAVLYMNTDTGYTSRSPNVGWVKVGRTEVIYDNRNPKVTIVVTTVCDRMARKIYKEFNFTVSGRTVKLKFVKNWMDRGIIDKSILSMVASTI